MKALLLVLLPFLACGQEHLQESKNVEQDLYVQAIGDFLRTAQTKHQALIDTLFIIDRKNGQPDDFPNITLPESSVGTRLMLLSAAEATRMQKERLSRTAINLMGWIEPKEAEFQCVVFSKGFAHQYDVELRYRFDAQKKAYILETNQLKTLSIH